MTESQHAEKPDVTGASKMLPEFERKGTKEKENLSKSVKPEKVSISTVPAKVEVKAETAIKEDVVVKKSDKEKKSTVTIENIEKTEMKPTPSIKSKDNTEKAETKATAQTSAQAMVQTAPTKTAKGPSANKTTSDSSSLSSSANKKRKITQNTTAPHTQHATTANNSQGPPIISTLADPKIKQIVHDLLALLQLHGPLSHIQLEHNISSISSIKNEDKKSLLNDILELLVAIGIVKRVKTNNDDPSLRLYCVFGEKYPINTKVARPDVILPQQVLPELERAHSQWSNSIERTQILKNYLKGGKDGGEKMRPRELLLSMMEKYGAEMANDPVYVTAMRTFGIHIGGSNPKKRQSNAKRSSTSSGKSASPTSHKITKNKAKEVKGVR